MEHHATSFIGRSENRWRKAMQKSCCNERARSIQKAVPGSYPIMAHNSSRRISRNSFGYGKPAIFASPNKPTFFVFIFFEHDGLMRLFIDSWHSSSPNFKYCIIRSWWFLIGTDRPFSQLFTVFWSTPNNSATSHCSRFFLIRVLRSKSLNFSGSFVSKKAMA